MAPSAGYAPAAGRGMALAVHARPGEDACGALEDADVVAEATMVSQRLAGVPMENNGLLAVPQADGTLTCWLSHQAPHSATTVASRPTMRPLFFTPSFAFAMLASEVLGIPMANITLVNSDTARVPRGSGTMGSRSLQTAGSAIHRASTEVMARAKHIAAHLLEAATDDIVKGDNGLQVAGVPSQSISWSALAAASQNGSQLPDGIEPGLLRHELDFDGQGSTFPFGAHVSVVEVDTETGAVKMLRHIAVDDCGRILNPLLAAGQPHGGIAQGAAQALFEWVRYDESGNPQTANLMDYAIPSAAELPS